MRKTLAAAAVLATVLAPTGTAHAETWNDTGNGKAYGNCRNSSSGGVHDYDRYEGGVADKGARGMGGHVDEAKADHCVKLVKANEFDGRLGTGDSDLS